MGQIAQPARHLLGVLALCTAAPLVLSTGTAWGVTVSGDVTCPDCDLGVRVLLFGPEGASPAPPLAETLLLAPGPWSLEAPPDLGEVTLYAGREPLDLDALIAYSGNPLAIGDADLTDLDLAIPGAPPPPSVAVSGVAV